MPLFGHRSLGEDYENNIKKEVDSDNEVSVYNEEEYDGDVDEDVEQQHSYMEKLEAIAARRRRLQLRNGVWSYPISHGYKTLFAKRASIGKVKEQSEKEEETLSSSTFMPPPSTPHSTSFTTISPLPLNFPTVELPENVATGMRKATTKRLVSKNVQATNLKKRPRLLASRKSSSKRNVFSKTPCLPHKVSHLEKTKKGYKAKQLKSTFQK